MDIKKKSITPVYDERFDRFGVYVWITDDERIVKNENNDVMYIKGEYGDLKRVRQLAEAAKSYGIEGGHARFLPGARITDDEGLHEQTERLNQGIIPDEYDLSAIVEEAEETYGKKF